ncbi:MAG: hypothetical protein ABR991_11950 [Terracidiphilus sp.]|jgi:hypothetical protein
MSIIQDLPHIITAIGGLGTAAFGLVDATKSFGGGVNRIGFKRIEAVVRSLTPGATVTGLTQNKIVDTVRANWYNGKDLASQKSIAKSLIKVGLNPGNAADLATLTGVDPAVLKHVATSIGSGTPLKPNESEVNARFDFVLTALLDEVYQDSDQAYTNGTRIVAFAFAMLLAFLGGWILQNGTLGSYLTSNDLWLALITGVLATPLAPIAKDLSSALVTAVNAMQLVKK